MIVSLSIIVLLTVAVALLTCFAPRTDSSCEFYGTDTSFLESLSLVTYRPMLRLATQMDRKFLSSAHGEVLAGCYRKIQRNLLREYLRDASKDFKRLHAIATAKTVHASSDPDELSTALFEQHMTFILLVWGIEARLLLDNVLPFAVDLQPLIGQLDALARQTRDLARPQYSYRAYGSF
jgi:hypothetical protein